MGTKQLALEIRKNIIHAAHNAGKQGVHIGGALSMTEILASLYGHLMNYDPKNPTDATRDRLILSKGHDCIGLYSALTAIGVITEEELKENYLKDNGFLPTHPVKNLEKGIECSSGSLGMGLGFGVGKALYAKLQGKDYKTFVIVGDGECNEGSIWEAVMSARQWELGNLVLFIDRNGLQSDGATKDIITTNLYESMKSFGWNTFEVDGHNTDEIIKAVEEGFKTNNQPIAVVCNTVKGKGVSFMENDNTWHHGHLSEEQYEQAISELNKQL